MYDWHHSAPSSLPLPRQLPKPPPTTLLRNTKFYYRNCAASESQTGSGLCSTCHARPARRPTTKATMKHASFRRAPSTLGPYCTEITQRSVAKRSKRSPHHALPFCNRPSTRRSLWDSIPLPPNTRLQIRVFPHQINPHLIQWRASKCIFLISLFFSNFFSALHHTFIHLVRFDLTAGSISGTVSIPIPTPIRNGDAGQQW